MILRWDVPVDDREHQIKCGSIVHVDCRRPQGVTFWADDFAAHNRTLRVFATGQPVDDGWVYVGTGLTPATDTAPRGYFVWHLFELDADESWRASRAEQEPER